MDSPAQAERSFSGVIVARVQSNLGFRVSGKVTERFVDTGAAVTKGQPLMEVDPADFQLTQRALDEAVVAARSRASQTAADEKRYRDLVSAGAVSVSAYEEIKASADSAQAQLNAAQAQANVARNEAGYAVLLADSDGVVMETLAEPGQVVAAGQPVVRIARSGPREARIDLPENLRPKIGSAATAFLYGSDATSSRAKLRQLSNAADSMTRTYEARYVLEGVAAAAPLGATVNVRVPNPNAAGSSVRSPVEVPLAALHDRGKGPGVWIISGEPKTVSWRSVEISALAAETASVLAGLEPGEKFVALGAHLLDEGQPVRMLNDHAGATE